MTPVDAPDDHDAPHQIVEALQALGLAQEAALQAVEQDRVALALVEQIAESQRPYDLATLSERSGLPAELLREWEQALGLAPRERFGEADVAHARALAEFLRLVPAPMMEQLLWGLRADGQTLARMAMGNLELIRDHYIRPLHAAGAGDIAVALGLADAARTLLPLAADLVGGAYQRVLGDLISSELVAAAARSGGDAVDLCVGFVDMTGFTSLSARIDPAGLDGVIGAFEARCYTVAGARTSMQVVKFLGDAAMFVGVDAIAMAEGLLEAIEAVPAPDGPLAGVELRGGMAAGPVLPRGGDYYGGPVNLAARLTDRARSGTLLAAEDLERTLAPHWQLSRLPSLRLHGLGRHRPLRVRRRASAATG
jgi:adenylate cyclase